MPVTEPLGFFPNGFPEPLIKAIEEFSGRKVIVNRPISGTEVIVKYGEEQLETGALIVYTSGDSVLQIAANTAIISLDELYRICKYVREITIDEYHIGRIIARPYVGKDKSEFKRTSDRHDFTLVPPKDTVLDMLGQAGFEVMREGEMAPLVTGCSSQESESCFLSGQHRRAGSGGLVQESHPEGMRAGKLTLSPACGRF